MDKQLSRERASKTQEKTNHELLRCCACDFVTVDQHILNEHLLDHYGPKKFKCDECHFLFRTQGMLDEHVKLNHTQFRKFRCTDCAYATNHRHQLQAHVTERRCVGNQDQNDDDGQGMLDEHVKLNHTQFRKFRCTDCPYATNHRHQLQAHVTERRCMSNQDQNDDDGQGILDEHVKLNHTQFRKFRCTDCAYATNHRHQLQAHVTERRCMGNQDQNDDDGYGKGRSTGREEWDYRYLGKVREYGSYQRHSRSYLNVASSSTATMSTCNVGIKIQKAKTLVCDECGYRAGSDERLESHRRVHDSFKPYECEKCSYMGFSKSEFNEHVKSHSDACKFHCGDCDYATNHHHALKLHLRRNEHFAEMLPITDDLPVHEENVQHPTEEKEKEKEIEIIEI